MGDRTFATVDSQSDVKATPAATNNTAVHPEENGQKGHAHDHGATQVPGEQQDAEPAWQGVPL